jgi:hypothetical protein
MLINTTDTIKLKDAIKRMRELSLLNIPFAFSFITYSDKLKESKGIKVIDKALLRAGYNKDQSKLHNILIAYTSFDNSEVDRQFYLPLIMTFNHIRVIP